MEESVPSILSTSEETLHRATSYRVITTLWSDKTYEFITSMQEIKLQDCGQRRRWEWEDTQVITLVVIALAVAFYTIRYPITIEAQGKVYSNDSVELLVPYKYLYLFDEPIQAKVTYKGQESEARPSIYPIISSNDILVKISGSNYFLATAYIGSDSTKVKVGQEAEARIIVSDKTLWQQIFRK